MRNARKVLSLFLVLSLLLGVFAAGGTSFAAGPDVRNVIVLVADGCGSTHTTLARWYQGQPLTLDGMVTGGVITHSADSMITDSAPAATAFATGYKSDTKFISVLPAVIDVPHVQSVSDNDKYRPVASVLEAAKLAGKSTGLVATSNIQHATPACYSAHWPNRNDYNEIAEQQVYEDIDVVFGGGRQYLLPVHKGGKRTDGADLINELKYRGYKIVDNTADMKKFDGTKVWGLFADDALAYDMDRDPAKEPSLAEMTQKAIEILSKNKKGFFLFIEGSKVDWASHANDPIGVISDVLAFDRAVKTAVDFAKKDGHTLVIAFSDHGNGGMSIGSMESNKNYDTLKPSQVVDPLKKAKLTGEGLEAKLNADRSNIAEVMAAYYGITDLTEQEIQAIKEAKPGSLNYAVGPMISKRSMIGWTTNGHCGEDLFLYAYGPQKPAGLLDNTQIAKHIAAAMGLDLAKTSKTLFTPAEAFKTLSAEVTVDKSDPENPVIKVQKGHTTMTLKTSTDIAVFNGKTYILNGPSLLITVKNKAGEITHERAYVPQQAVDLFAGQVKKAA